MSHETKRYEAWVWLKELHARGYDRYYHKNLPDDLKNEALHKSAALSWYVATTGRKDHGVKEYYIRQSILNLSNPAHYRGRGAV